MDGVLLTGATGFVGMELMARYLSHTDRPVYALVRARDARQARERMDEALRCMFGAAEPYAERVVAVRGDITQPRLGIGRDYERLAAQVSEIVHGAASVSFDLNLRAARAINAHGTQRMLQFAETCLRHGGLRRFSYISTAYVSGQHEGCFSEDDLYVGQRFRNAYEQSKFEAERSVAAWRERLPLTVMRPSIVVGERHSGWTASFNVLYWPLRAYASGAYRVLPAARDTPVDAVPVDYVADAIFRLSQTPQAEGATFHVSAGEHASSLGELVDLASAFFERPRPRLLAPALYRRAVHPLLVRLAPDPRVRRTLARSETYFPYFTARARYDNRRCRVALHGSGIEPAPLSAYFERLVQFALAADWGRKPIPRARRLFDAGRSQAGVVPTRRPVGGGATRQLAGVR